MSIQRLIAESTSKVGPKLAEIDRLAKTLDTKALELWLTLSNVKKKLARDDSDFNLANEATRSNLAEFAELLDSTDFSKFRQQDRVILVELNAFFQAIAGRLEVNEKYPKHSGPETRQIALNNSSYGLGGIDAKSSVELVMPAIVWELTHVAPDDRPSNIARTVAELERAADLFTPAQKGIFDAITLLFKTEQAQAETTTAGYDISQSTRISSDHPNPQIGSTPPTI